MAATKSTPARHAAGDLRVAAVAAPVRAQVLSKLRDAILARTFAPGERLIERELCELTGVSRTSIREALRQLETEGLVVVIPNRGPVVAPEMSLDEAADLYDIRSVLEVLVCRRFATLASDEEMAALVAAADALTDAAEEGDIAAMMRRKDAMYEVLLGGTRNTVARSVLASLHQRIAYLRTTSLSRPGRAGKAAHEVRALVEAIVARDAPRAAALCEAHVHNAAETALGVLAASGGASQA
jgi:DNA-binding GntR family transcriptional regulator